MLILFVIFLFFLNVVLLFVWISISFIHHFDFDIHVDVDFHVDFHVYDHIIFMNNFNIINFPSITNFMNYLMDYYFIIDEVMIN